MAGGSRSFSHLPQLSASGLYLPLERSDGGGTDAFLQPWDGLQAYAFPPFALICQVLNKLRFSRGIVLTLVAPLCPQKERFLKIQSLAVAPPVALPMRADLLRQLHIHLLHQNLHVLQLHARRLCCDLRDT